jgi:hypothetical protein
MLKMHQPKKRPANPSALRVYANTPRCFMSLVKVFDDLPPGSDADVRTAMEGATKIYRSFSNAETRQFVFVRNGVIIAVEDTSVGKLVWCDGEKDPQ